MQTFVGRNNKLVLGIPRGNAQNKRISELLSGVNVIVLLIYSNFKININNTK